MSNLTTMSYALLGLTFLGGVLLLVLVVMIMRLAKGRGGKRQAENRGEVAMLSIALQEAVTKLKAQERATAARAEASERLASQIVEGLTSGLVVVDRAGEVQSINPAARRLLHLDDAAGLGPYREVFAAAPGLADVISETLATAVAGHAPHGVDRRSRDPCASASPCRRSSTAAGALQAAVCLFTDLTEVMELEEQLRLREALARLGELTAGLAHEFRNGLATIHGYGRLLDPATLPEPQRAYVEGIRAETTALGEVVTNFLRFAKPDPLALAPLDLRAIIDRAAEDVKDGRGHRAYRWRVWHRRWR